MPSHPGQPHLKQMCRPEFSDFNPALPSISVSPSQASASTVASVTSAGSIYSHWFAVDLYNLSLKLESGSSDEAVAIIQDVTIRLPSVERIVRVFQSVSGLRGDNESFQGLLSDHQLRTSELTITAILSRELDRFLFDDASAHLGACYHQFPTSCDNRHSAQRPDFHVMKLCEDRILPRRTVGVSDLENLSYDKANIATFCASTTAMKKSNPTNCFSTCLAFPATSDTIKLQVHVGLNNRIIVIDVLEAHFATSAIGNFCKVLYAAVHYQIQHRIESHRPCISPIRSISLRATLTHISSQTVPCRVFVDDERMHVYKLYDTKKDSPNFNLAKEVLPNARVTSLSSDDRFQCLRYDYLNGGHTAENIIQFCDILRQLSGIHAAGYCHSDIRSVNIVFGKNRTNAWLIDFDLAAKEGVRYPDNFNCTHIKERHPDAIAENKREKSHDCYALSVIMKKNGVPFEFAQAVEDCGDLLQIAEALERHCCEP